MKKECVFIDVFTDVPYAGNQLAVFPDSEGLTAQQMQQLAQEINYSETVFLSPDNKKECAFELRIFTVAAELPFAGHPVLGAAYSTMNIFGAWPEEQDILRLKTKAGVIPLERKGINIWMTQNEPVFSEQYEDKAETAEMVSLLPEDIADDLPIEEVSTGNNIVIIPVKNLAVINRANGHVNKLRNFFDTHNAEAPYLFTRETENNNAGVHTRFLAAHMGITEDAATGSAAGSLTAYLLKYNLFGNAFNIINEQGLEMGRPSQIMMHGEIEHGRYVIKIGGTCVYAGKGEFCL